MERISDRHAKILCVLAICGVTALPARPDHDTPEQIISKARTMVSLDSTGPMEIQADLRIASPSGELKGTYTLDWAAPGRFRREIHLPGYDEVSVANGTTMYRKRNLNYTPLAAFRVEELMDPDEVLAQVQRSIVHPSEAVLDIMKSLWSDAAKLPGTTTAESAAYSTTCVQVPFSFYELLCANDKRDWPISVAGRRTADGETIRYLNYKPVGSGFLPMDRRYFDGERFLIAATVTQIRELKTVAPETFATPFDAEQFDWCYNETPAQIVPLIGPLPIDPDTFQNGEIVDAFVNADGTPSRLQIIGTEGPAADAALQKIANLIRFEPAVCGGKRIKSEVSVMFGERDAAFAGLGNETNTHLASKNGYTKPICLHCSQPQYSDDGFREKVQGEIVLSTVVTSDGQARDV